MSWQKDLTLTLLSNTYRELTKQNNETKTGFSCFVQNQLTTTVLTKWLNPNIISWPIYRVLTKHNNPTKIRFTLTVLTKISWPLLSWQNDLTSTLPALDFLVVELLSEYECYIVQKKIITINLNNLYFLLNTITTTARQRELTGCVYATPMTPRKIPYIKAMLKTNVIYNAL